LPEAPRVSSTPGISLIAGLGNPGPEYADTRHNAGFRFLAALLEGRGRTLKNEGRFAGRVAQLDIGGRELWLLAPDTFMNHSGESVAKLAHYYKIPANEILAVHDDLDLPPGVARLKFDGGAGGHNGIADLVEKLGTPDFFRLRLGIGRPATSAQVVSFVLKKAPAAEQALTGEAIRAALGVIEDIVHGRLQQAMNALHSHTSQS
jgi:PTH1 family peptidyl-tRNA hydrolase